jgi:hypothetical protein
LSDSVSGVVDQGGHQRVVRQGLAVGQLADHEAVPGLGQRGEHVLAGLLAAQLATRADVPGGVGGQGGHEKSRVSALLDQTPVPGPGQGHGFGHGVLFLVRAPEVTEEDGGVQLDPREKGQEAGMQRIEGGSGVVGIEGCHRETASQWGPFPSGGAEVGPRR